MVTMSQDPLKTYLLTYRKRTGLSQDEIAFLLGISSGTTVSKHETGARTPHLDGAMSYEIILGPSTHVLFAGRYLELARRIQRRAAKLLPRVEARPAAAIKAQKLKSIRRLLESRANTPKA